MASHAARWLGALTLVVGCGPTKLSGSDSTESSSDTSPDGPGDGDGDPSATSQGTDSTNSTDSTDSTDSDSVGFVPDPDGGPPPNCDMFAQDCGEDEKCVPSFGDWNDFRCVPVLGDKGVGESCIYAGNQLATDDCDGNSHCWQTTEVDGELVGVCVPFCGGTPDNPGDCDSVAGCDGYDCHVYGQVGIPICEPRCDPLLQDCPAGRSCSLDYSGSFTCWVLYEPVAAGEPCESRNSCEPGSLCVDGFLVPDCAGRWCCAPVCDLADPDAAAADCAVLPGSTCLDDALATNDVGCGQIGLCGAPP